MANNEVSMRFLQRFVVGLVLAAISLGGVAVAVSLVADAVVATMRAPPRAVAPREIVRRVPVVAFESTTQTPLLRAYGEVLSHRTLEVRAPVAGTVVALAPEFRTGGRVAAGQLLVQIDPVPAEAELAVAEADLARGGSGPARCPAQPCPDARGSGGGRGTGGAAPERAGPSERAGQSRGRHRGGGRRGGAGGGGGAPGGGGAQTGTGCCRGPHRPERDPADPAEIAVSEARRRLNETTIRARFAGTLSAVSLVEGRLLSANEILAQLVDPRALEVGFRISTAQHARLLDGEGRLIGLPVQVRLEVSGLDLLVAGVIDRDAAVVEAGQTGRQIFARLDAAAALRPGDFVTVEVAEPPLSGVARLPASALGPAGTVLVVGPEDRLQEAPVRLERRQGDEVLVRGALEGRQVVAERTPLLGAGLKVRPVAPSPSGAAPPPEMLRLDPARRARLVAFVKGDAAMSGAVKSRLLGQLRQAEVPSAMVARLERRMGS